MLWPKFELFHTSNGRHGRISVQKRVSVKRSYRLCDWGRTHITVEREYMERRDHRTSLMWHRKGDPHLSASVPHAVHTAHLAREETARRAPQGWVLMISPLAYTGAAAGTGVAASGGWQAEGERGALGHTWGRNTYGG